MSKRWILVVAGLALMVGTCFGAGTGDDSGGDVTFTVPTEEQLSAAAENPDLVGDLLAGASATEAAEVIRSVIARIVSLSLPTADQTARITALIGQAFAALPSQTVPLSAALGTAMSGGSFTPEVVSTVQQTVITAAGSAGSEAGIAFGNAYTPTLSADLGVKSDPDSKSEPEAPPLGQFYEGQQLL